MMTNTIADCLEQEIVWFSHVCETRMNAYFQQSENKIDLEATCPAPDLSQSSSPYANLVREHNMSFSERIVLMLAFIPHLRPQALDIFSMQNAVLGRAYSEIGGWHGKVISAFYPRVKQRHLFWPEPTSQYVLR
jgi:hypothetical protein